MQVKILEHIREDQAKQFDVYKWFDESKNTGFINIFFNQSCDENKVPILLPSESIIEIEKNGQYWNFKKIIKMSEQKPDSKPEVKEAKFASAKDVLSSEKEQKENDYSFGIACKMVGGIYAEHKFGCLQEIKSKSFTEDIKTMVNLIKEARKECR